MEGTDIIVTSTGIVNGVILDAYGARGDQKSKDVPTLSLPLVMENYPETTAGFAVVMTDPDSVPVCGYEWVHWLALFTDNPLARNASVENKTHMVQGKNSFGTRGYGGPTPPDKTHEYVITVYALDKMPKLSGGFSQEKLMQALEGNVLAQGELRGTYAP